MSTVITIDDQEVAIVKESSVEVAQVSSGECSVTVEGSNTVVVNSGATDVISASSTESITIDGSAGEVEVSEKISKHASTHEHGGTDQIDGDNIDIDLVPLNYGYGDILSGHLGGIDTKLGTIGSDLNDIEEAFSIHESDGDIHFLEESIDHKIISNIGDYDHDTIDDHIDNATIHFTKKSISGTYLTVDQVAHGLSVQEAIYFDGTDWKKAQANAIATLGEGIVQEVAGVDNFTVVLTGKITGLSGLNSGEWYYTSDATAGLLTTTESAIYSNPLLLATSTTTGIVVPLRAQDIGGSSLRVTRCDYDSTNPQYLYTGTADPATPTSSALWRISRYDFTDGSVVYADGNQNYDNIYDSRESLSYS